MFPTITDSYCQLSLFISKFLSLIDLFPQYFLTGLTYSSTLQTSCKIHSGPQTSLLLDCVFNRCQSTLGKNDHYLPFFKNNEMKTHRQNPRCCTQRSGMFWGFFYHRNVQKYTCKEPQEVIQSNLFLKAGSSPSKSDHILHADWIVYEKSFLFPNVAVGLP